MARPTYPSDRQDQFMLRLPAGMRDKLKQAAAQNGRSTNAEIVARLEDAEDFADLKDRLAELEIQNEALTEQRDYLANLVAGDGARHVGGDGGIVRRILNDLRDQASTQDREAVELMQKQSEMIETLLQSQQTAHKLISSMHKALEDAASGDSERLSGIVSSYAKLKDEE